MIDRPPASRNARALVWGSIVALILAAVVTLAVVVAGIRWYASHRVPRARSLASRHGVGGMYGPAKPAPRPTEASSSPIVRAVKWAELDTSKLEAKPGPFDPPPTTIRSEPESAGDTATYRYQGGYHWYWSRARNGWIYSTDRETARREAERLDSGLTP